MKCKKCGGEMTPKVVLINSSFLGEEGEPQEIRRLIWKCKVCEEALNDKKILKLSKSTIYSFEELKVESEFFSKLSTFRKYIRLKPKINLKALHNANVDIDKYIDSLI